ncbi:unnamed protein product [Lampetra fluviatilis]
MARRPAGAQALEARAGERHPEPGSDAVRDGDGNGTYNKIHRAPPGGAEAWLERDGRAGARPNGGVDGRALLAARCLGVARALTRARQRGVPPTDSHRPTRLIRFHSVRSASRSHCSSISGTASLADSTAVG